LGPTWDVQSRVASHPPLRPVWVRDPWACDGDPPRVVLQMHLITMAVTTVVCLTAVQTGTPRTGVLCTYTCDNMEAS
jgi:hypothetical protein